MKQLFIAGDSTAAIKNLCKHPETGWGEALTNYVTKDLLIINYAKNGRSSKTFIEEGLLTLIAKQIQPGDYLLIQFGHNDEKTDTRHTDPKTTYPFYLKKFIKVATDVGATPILLTSIPRLTHSIYDQTHLSYIDATKKLAIDSNVLYLDIFHHIIQDFEKMSFSERAQYFLRIPPGSHVNYPNGIIDNTHLNQYGANFVALSIISEIKNLIPSFNFYLK